MKKIETHLHTAPNSNCAIEYPRDIIRLYKKIGYDVIVVTNHITSNIYSEWIKEGKNPVEEYLVAYHDMVKYGKKANIDVWLGAEVNLERYNRADIHGPVHEFLLYNINEKFIIDNPNIFDLSQEELYSLVKASDGYMFQAHPFRSHSRLANLDYLDGLEVYNGNRRHNSHNSEAYSCANEHDKHMISGSDFHQRGDEGTSGMLVPTLAMTCSDFMTCVYDGSAVIIKDEEKWA